MTTLYIDTKNLIIEFVSSSRCGLKGHKVFREILSIEKSVKAYGLDDEINHLKNVYKAKEIVFCNLK